jgi:hypothetical protein
LLYSDNLFETNQWVEMIQVNECGLRESSGEKKEAIEVGAKFVWGRLWMCFNRESDGREKWRFGLDDKNIYTVVRDCDRKIKNKSDKKNNY